MSVGAQTKQSRVVPVQALPVAQENPNFYPFTHLDASD